jgi:hypothetical protein
MKVRTLWISASKYHGIRAKMNEKTVDKSTQAPIKDTMCACARNVSLTNQ